MNQWEHINCLKIEQHRECHGSVVVRTSTSQLVELGLISLLSRIKKIYKGHSQLPCLALSMKKIVQKQTSKFSCGVLGQGTSRDAFILAEPSSVYLSWLSSLTKGQADRAQAHA